MRERVEGRVHGADVRDHVQARGQDAGRDLELQADGCERLIPSVVAVAGRDWLVVLTRTLVDRFGLRLNFLKTCCDGLPY